MGNRYPELGEPVRTLRGLFKVISLMTGEFVECPVCAAVLRKPSAKKHAAWHTTLETALTDTTVRTAP